MEIGLLTGFPIYNDFRPDAKIHRRFTPLIPMIRSIPISFCLLLLGCGTVVVNRSTSSTASAPTVSKFTCTSATLAAPGSDACTVILSANAPSGGLSVNLSSSVAEVALPSSVTVPAGTMSAGFTASVLAVSSKQTARLTASTGSTSVEFDLQLNLSIAPVPQLSVSAASVAFGNVTVNTPATQSLTLSSIGTAAVTISSATVSGVDFTISGLTVPVTLPVGQTTRLNVQFDPTSSGTVSGSLTLTSNSSPNSTFVAGLSGTGTNASSGSVTISLNPTAASTVVGSTQQFTATVSGSSNTNAIWSLSGAGCTGSTCGTISSQGLYTAPSSAPSPAAVTVTATSLADTTASASASVTINAAASNPGATYYLATASGGGNDSNTGISASSPWLSPNHSLKCGDVILAAPSSSYDQANFQFGKWGSVICSPGSSASVAWLKCASFDACKLSATNQDGMWVTASYWGVQGWEVSASGGQSICFAAMPPTSGANIHHIIFANNIANGCYGAGMQTVPNGSAGVDYFVLIGNIVYNAAQQSVECSSGISITGPSASDSLPGSHIYIAGNLAWANVDPSYCSGTTPTDGEGIILDTLDSNSYRQQVVVENNLAFFNGSSGIRVDKTTMTPIYLINNTSFGNNGDYALNSGECGEITLQESTGVHVLNNIAETNSATGCGSGPDYAFYVASGDNLDVVSGNLGYSASGYDDGVGGSPSFTYGSTNLFGTDADFVSPPSSTPGSPVCGGFNSVASCMSGTIKGLLPQASGTSNLGYQLPGSSSTPDPYFPSWLCNVNLPVGLIPNHC